MSMRKAAASLVREKRSTEASRHVSGPEGLARDRYAELVDKKFRSSLSDSEQAELLLVNDPWRGEGWPLQPT